MPVADVMIECLVDEAICLGAIAALAALANVVTAKVGAAAVAEGLVRSTNLDNATIYCEDIDALESFIPFFGAHNWVKGDDRLPLRVCGR